MDERCFDDWIREFSLPQRRRNLMAAIAGAMLTTLGLATDDALGKKRRKGRGKGKKRKKKGGNKPAARQCQNDLNCPDCQICDGGRCVPDVARNGYWCPTCGICQNGVCTPDPRQDGYPCQEGSCKLCKNGECSVIDRDRCPEGQTCRPGDGVCAPPCLENGQICPSRHVCVDDGVFGAENWCCHVETDPRQPPTNTPCGSNGDGTFAQCCSSATERCCKAEGVCKRKEDCCANETRCGSTCCPPGEQCINGQCTGCGLTGLC